MDFSINQVQLQGRAGKDAVVKELTSGTTVAEFSLCTEKSFKKSGSNEWSKTTCWHNIKGWSKTAEYMGRVRKGDLVHVTGSIEDASYTNKDGIKVNKTEIVATSFGVLVDYTKKDQQGYDQGPGNDAGESY